MCEGISTYNCLVRLNRNTGDCCYQPACRINLFAHNPRISRKNIFTDPQNHGNLLERCIACPFPNAVYSAFYLTGTVLDGSYRVCNGKSEIVVAMHAYNSLGDIRDIFLDVSNKPPEFFWYRITNCVRHIYGNSASIDHLRKNPAKIIPIASCSIHRREFYIIGVFFRPFHSTHCDLQYLIPVFTELMFQVYVRGRNKCVDTWLCSNLYRFPCAIYIFLVCPCKTGYFAIFYCLCYKPYRIKVSIRGYRKASFNNIDTKKFKLSGHP
ncbi:MAG: hypothetical protein BWX58_01587 [Deltaproteobacteria bacterium ADurb.Bin026]|nr:MAG: hypothetical protein BWX58_01587 [Deltaproteobacteria bacterium ADurb.Bin026]